MEKFIIGKKLGMTQLFDADGRVVPVSVVDVSSCIVVRKKDVENDGYNAVVIGYQAVKESKLNKPEKGLFNKMGVEPRKYLKELRIENLDAYEIGKEIKAADVFKDGDVIDVSGVSKGKGFQGVIKRHGQSRGPMSHGSDYHRRVGSMGACSSPSRVFKGKKLPGRMGADEVTVQNLDIVRVDEKKDLILIKGAIPGPKGGVVRIKGAVKNK